MSSTGDRCSGCAMPRACVLGHTADGRCGHQKHPSSSDARGTLRRSGCGWREDQAPDLKFRCQSAADNGYKMNQKRASSSPRDRAAVAATAAAAAAVTATATAKDGERCSTSCLIDQLLFLSLAAVTARLSCTRAPWRQAADNAFKFCDPTVNFCNSSTADMCN